MRFDVLPCIVDYTDEYIIEPAYVEYQLSRVNIHKSSACDGVPKWLLREFAPLISDPVAAIFNASVREGYVPLIQLRSYQHPKLTRLSRYGMI